MEYRAGSTRLDITDGYLGNDSFPNMTTDGVEESPLHDDSLYASPVVDSVSRLLSHPLPHLELS